jgi:Hinge domain of cleavage stimulation factor subunit 2
MFSAPERAPESISKAMASLPPEQMFELLKQMKTCIQQNPDDAKSMLYNFFSSALTLRMNELWPKF